MEELIKTFGVEKLQDILQKVTIENRYSGVRRIVDKIYVGVNGMTIYIEDSNVEEEY